MINNGMLTRSKRTTGRTKHTASFRKCFILTCLLLMTNSLASKKYIENKGGTILNLII